jgi:undecaprenyl-diphosphatase
MNRPASVSRLPPFTRLNQWEAGMCRRCNQLARISGVRRYFAVSSRLGDGLAWYALLVLLPVILGPSALQPVVHMAGTSLAAIVAYKAIKLALGRERPFAALSAVEALVPALDRYSFPSGHTMHAVAFSVMVAQYYPALLVVVLPFALSVALSRVVLGLHYPTDVLAGAALGAAIARASLTLVGG